MNSLDHEISGDALYNWKKEAGEGGVRKEGKVKIGGGFKVKRFTFFFVILDRSPDVFFPPQRLESEVFIKKKKSHGLSSWPEE